MWRGDWAVKRLLLNARDWARNRHLQITGAMRGKSGCANPHILKLLETWRDEARSKGSKLQHVYAKVATIPSKRFFLYVGGANNLEGGSCEQCLGLDVSQRISKNF